MLDAGSLILVIVAPLTLIPRAFAADWPTTVDFGAAGSEAHKTITTCNIPEA
jgi:hypothetical protein